MSVYQIYFEGRVKMMRPVTSATEYRSLRDNIRQRQLVKEARNGNANAKRQLLQFNYSCIPGEEGKLRGCKQPSNTVGMDIDLTPLAQRAEEQTHVLQQAILEKREQLGLLLLERSVSKGYHLVFRRRPELSQVENLRWASDLLHVQFDQGAKDITRVFFATTASEEDLIFLDPSLFVIQTTEGRKDLSSESAPVLKRDSSSSTTPLNDKADDKSDDKPAEGAPLLGRGGGEVSYQGIPYARIIRKYWDMHNDGQEPVTSNRDTLTYELALMLRHICGYDRELMDRVIPQYDGFPEEEKLKCIDSALSREHSLMPAKLRAVLAAVKQEMRTEGGNTQALEEMEQEDELYYFRRLPRQALGQGVWDSIMACGPQHAMPVLVGICPAIGALATGVKLVVERKPNTLNLISFIEGTAGSGKGQLDPVIEAWMWEEVLKNDLYDLQEEEYYQRVRDSKNSKQQPTQPKLPRRYITLNNTIAMVSERLGNTQGKHAFSFSPEADIVSMRWAGEEQSFSTMVRQAYDGSRFDREAKSAEAVRVHIRHLLWNVTLCGTEAALHRLVKDANDGMESRMAIARTPDNTFQLLTEDCYILTPEQEERIHQVAHLLPLMQGTIELPALQKHVIDWTNQLCIEAAKNYDRAMAGCRKRDHVIAQRMVACLMLCRVCEQLIEQEGYNAAEQKLQHDPGCWMELMRQEQTPEMMQVYDVIAESLVDNDLFFFRERIEAGLNGGRNQYTYGGMLSPTRSRHSRNDSIFERLPQSFTLDEARQQALLQKGANTTDNDVRMMLRNWISQSLIEKGENGTYQKCV